MGYPSFDLMGELSYDWVVDRSICGNEVFLEEYSCKDFPICVKLEKRGMFWVSGFFYGDSKNCEMFDSKTHFGADSYIQACHFFIDFSRNMEKRGRPKDEGLDLSKMLDGEVFIGE